MELKGEIARLLREMGDTPDAVAATLTASNVQGVRNTVRTLNPVVRYIQVKVKSEAIEFDVIKGDALRVTYPKDRHEEVAIPDPVWQFLFALHRGQYPALELDSKSV